MQPATPTAAVSSDTTLVGPTAGQLTVRPAISLTIEGRHEGSIELEGDSELVVLGELVGRLEIGSLATARIAGSVVGDVDVRIAGSLIVESGGRLDGAVANFGSFTNSGSRSGRVEGRTPDDRPGSTASR